MTPLQFINTWQKCESLTQNKIGELWRRNFPKVDDQFIQERIPQVVFAVETEGAVVGVSTAYKALVPRLKHNFFAFRCFIDPAWRIPGLTSQLIVRTRDFLEEFNSTLAENEKCIGLITLVENERIKKYRNEAVWPASQMIYIGNSPKGHHIRVYYFNKAMLNV